MLCARLDLCAIVLNSFDRQSVRKAEIGQLASEHHPLITASCVFLLVAELYFCVLVPLCAADACRSAFEKTFHAKTNSDLNANEPASWPAMSRCDVEVPCTTGCLPEFVLHVRQDI